MTTQPLAIPMDQSRQRLLGRLRAVRGVGATAAVLAGCSQCLLLIAAMSFAAIWLDYSLRLPGPLRLVIGMALLLSVAAAAYQLVLRRLILPSLSRVARQVQQDMDGPPDCLASGAEFALADRDGPLIDRTIVLAAELSAQLTTTRLVRWRWLLGWLSAGLLAGILLAATWHQAGLWIERGLQRLAWPAVLAEWPKRTQIVSSLSGQEVLVPSGEPVTLQARLVRGTGPASVVLAEVDHVRRFEMTDSSQGTWTAMVQPTSSGTFWFEAGDDSTQATPGRIRLVPRPQVTRAEILVQPPAYTGQPASRFALGSSPVHVPEGSRIELTLSISKDLAEEAGRPKAAVTLSAADGPDTQRVEPLDARFGPDHRCITAGWYCRGDSLVRAEFADTDGLASVPVQPWRIVVRKDQLPTIDVQAPADNIEVAPTAALAVQAQVSDDWGIRDARLGWQISRASAATQPADSISVALGPAERLADAVRVAIDYPWLLEPLSLQPGDSVTWHMAVRDSFDLDGRTHEAVSSVPRTIRIISPVELLKSVLDELALTRTQIARLQAQQNQLSQTLSAPDAASQPAETLRQEAGRQGQIAQQTRTVAGVLAAAAHRLQINRTDRQDLAAAIDSAAVELNQVQARPMTHAQHDLQNAQAQPAGDQDRSANVADAARQAAAADVALQDLLQRTASWTTVESAALALQDLIARQQALGDQTQQVGKQTLGKSLDDLLGTQRQGLQDLSDVQRSMAEQLQRLQADMARQSVQSSQQPRLDQAVQTLQRQEAVAAMAGGADDIARNVTTSAQQRQGQAQAAMEQALGILRDLRHPADRPADQSTAGALAQRLKRLAQEQLQLKDQTSQIHSRSDATGQLDRPGLIRLGMAGTSQANLAEQVEQSGQQAVDADLQHSLRSTSSQMGRIAEQMRNGSSDGHVQDAQQQAAEQLLAMADSLDKQADEQAQQNSSDPSGRNQASRGGKPGDNNRSKSGDSQDTDQSPQDQQGQQAGAGNRGKQGGAEAARESAIPADQQPGPTAALPSQTGQVEAWGFLPPDQRRQLLQGMQAEPPARYRKLTERYWRMLNESVEPGAEEKMTR